MINPAAENQGTWITVKQLAALMGTYEKKAQRLALKADHRYELGLGRGGKVLKIRLESLDLSLQKKYFSQDSSAIAPAITTAIAPAAPVPAAAEKLPAKVVQLPVVPVKPKRTITPWQDERARVMYALAKTANEVKERASHSGKMRALKAFTDLYNQGCFILQDVFKVLGPVSHKTLQDWFHKLKVAGGDYTVLAPAHGDNMRGNFSLTEDEKNTFLEALLRPSEPTIGAAIRMAKAGLLFNRGIANTASDASYRRFAEAFKAQNYHIWVLAREGEKALDDKVLPYIERDPSLLEVGEYFVSDGKTINFNVLNPWTGKPCRASLVVFFDWASRYPAGFELNLTENIQCISSALRRAIIALGETPKWVLLDNGKAFKAQVFSKDVDLEQAGIGGLYARLGINVRYTRAYNAKDKVVERFWRTFQEWVERFLPSFCGTSVADKPAYMSRNEKFHKQMHNDYIPTIEEAIKLIEFGFAYYAMQPHSGLKGKCPREVWEAGKKKDPQPYALRELETLMMDAQIKTIYRNGIRLLGGYYYNEALFGYRDQVIIRYDIRDLRHILVFDKNNQFMCQATRTTKIHPVAQDRHDMEALKENQKTRARAVKYTKKAFQELQGAGQPIQIDWDHALETVPNLPEIIEAAQADVAEASIDQSIGQSEHPFFEYGWKKYDWLMGKGTLTADEQEWVTEYRAGIIEPGEFQALYGHQAAQ